MYVIPALHKRCQNESCYDKLILKMLEFFPPPIPMPRRTVHCRQAGERIVLTL